MTETNLKPCPFCGGKDDLECDDYGIHAVCTKCCSCTGCFQTREEVLNSWNSRPTEDVQNKEINSLRKALEEIKKTVAYAQDAVYPFHIDLDSKDGLYILEVTKEALEGNVK